MNILKQSVKKGKSKSSSNKTKKVDESKVRVKKNTFKQKKSHPKFGTSKLERDFSKNFLDKLGVRYIYQFEAKDIGRFYDFYLPDSNLLLEVDGSYHHSDPRVVKESEMNPMQKHNKRVDELKDKWALLHSIPLMRIWEYDIRNNPEEVMKQLKERLYIEDKKVELKQSKKKRGRKKKLNNLNKDNKDNGKEGKQ